MKKQILALAIAAAAFASCSKDSTTAVVDTGTVRYSNHNSGGNRYEIFLDGGSLGLLAAGSSKDKADIPTGSHTLQAKQYEGYVITPTVVSNTVTITKGVTLQFDFP